MAGNNLPIYTRVGDIQWSSLLITASNPNTDITGGISYLAFTADATNGGYVQRIRFKPISNTGNNNVATVARVYLNNGSSTGSSGNNTLIDEISLPATTGVVNAALPVYELPLNLAMPPGYTIYVTLGTTVAAGYRVAVIGGKY